MTIKKINLRKKSCPSGEGGSFGPELALESSECQDALKCRNFVTLHRAVGRAPLRDFQPHGGFASDKEYKLTTVLMRISVAVFRCFVRRIVTACELNVRRACRSVYCVNVFIIVMTQLSLHERKTHSLSAAMQFISTVR